MTNMRLTIGRGRAFPKNKTLPFSAKLKRFFKNSVFFPEFSHSGLRLFEVIHRQLLYHKNIAPPITFFVRSLHPNPRLASLFLGLKLKRADRRYAPTGQTDPGINFNFQPPTINNQSGRGINPQPSITLPK